MSVEFCILKVETDIMACLVVSSLEGALVLDQTLLLFKSLMS